MSFSSNFVRLIGWLSLANKEITCFSSSDRRSNLGFVICLGMPNRL
ncbi:hypothetical protein [Microcoleus sp.]